MHARRKCNYTEGILMIKQQKSFQKRVTGKHDVNSIFCKTILLVNTQTCISHTLLHRQLFCHKWNKLRWFLSLLAVLPSSCHTALQHGYFKGWQLLRWQCLGIKFNPLQDYCSLKLKKQRSSLKESRMLSKTQKSVSGSANAAIRLAFLCYLRDFF